jgi:uncharacterized repeat protein (TIGR03843 family)
MTDQAGDADVVGRADQHELLNRGVLEVTGRIMPASNTTFFGTVTLEGTSIDCVYKPVSGERPLWDFPDGTLAGREVATAIISEAAGIGAIPPTVLRDGPFGPGMVQLWIETTEEDVVEVLPPDEVPEGWRVVLHAHDRLGEPAVLAHADHPGLRDLAVLDIVVNNTDRKGGHLLPGLDGRVYGVDHGICLHTDPKLRTVLWGWIGEPVPPDTVEKLEKLRSEIDGGLGKALAEHITKFEIRALAERTDLLLAEGIFPEPGDDWRAIPWPLF